MLLFEDIGLNWAQPLAEEHLTVVGLGKIQGNQPKCVNSEVRFIPFTHSTYTLVPGCMQYSARHCEYDEETPRVLLALEFLRYVVQDDLWLPELGSCSNGLSIVTVLTNGMT